MFLFLFKNFSYLSSDINPTSWPNSVNLKSALSCLNNSLYSALDVIILYGSFVPFVTISSIKTPSYPDVPFAWPAKNKFSIFLYSNDNFKSAGSIQSYSIAYAGLVNSAFSRPGNVLYIAIWTSSGNEELIPCTYISSVFSPIGSINTWCLSLSLNLTTLSSIDGQYLGPVPSIFPAYNGDLCRFALIISCVFWLVYVK